MSRIQKTMAVDRQNTILEYHRKGDGIPVPGHPDLPSQSTVPQVATVLEGAMKTVPGFPGIAAGPSAVAQVSTEVRGILDRLHQPPVAVRNSKDTLGKRHVGAIQHVANYKPTQGGVPFRIPTGDVTQFAEDQSAAGDELVTQRVAKEAAVAEEPAEVIDLGRKLDERRTQLLDLLITVSTIKSDDDRFAVLETAQHIAPEYTADEWVAIINDYQLVADSVELQDALIVGGKVLRNAGGNSASLYTTTIILGQGGMGVVKDGFLLKEGRFLSAAVKEPIALVIDPTLDQQQQIDDHEFRKDNYFIEACNAKEYLSTPVENVVEVLFVSEPDRHGELPIIVYKKITNRDGKSEDLYTVAEKHAVAPSAKLLAFAAVVEGVARLHSQGKVHLDLKPENMVLNEKGEGVIIDPASMFSVLDTIDIIDIVDFPRPLIQKTWKNPGLTDTIAFLGYTPQLVDLNLVRQGR
ncbi:protein kinase family protein, partial [Candidatus Gracilibacteria bacterium]|nr:protein kinase family protein [Candidatus Gracilibacteria bacterium]